MYWLRRLLLALPWLRRARERELQEELRANLAIAIEDDPDSAHRTFGSLTQAQETSRAEWSLGWEGIALDLRLSVRGLLRAPAFTAVAIASLALGIGGAAALFSLVNTVVLKPLTYRQPGQLISIHEVVKPLAHLYPTMPVNQQHFRFWRENAQSFQSMASIVSGLVTLGLAADAETVGTATVSAGLFDTLGIYPAIGRSFHSEDEQPRASATAIITDGLWRRRFGASPTLLGNTILLNGHPYAVIGILPPNFRFPKNGELGALTRLAERTEIFLPLRDFFPGWGGDNDYIAIARMKPGVSQAHATAELNLLEQRIVVAHPEIAEGLHVQTQPLQDVIASPVRTGLAVLLAAVLVLMLIVCVNLANLLLARGSVRAREYSLRVALGASRAHLVISALIESLLLSLSGGALGILGASLAVNAFARLAPIDLPRADEAHVDLRVIVFAFGLSLFCSLIFGLLPAVRLAKADPQTALRAGGYASTGSAGGLRIREWLIGGEVALSTLLLVLAGLLVSSLWHVLHIDRGFSAEHTLDVTFMLPSKYRATADFVSFFDRAVASFRNLPGVRDAAAVNRPPLTGESNVNEVQVDGVNSHSIDPRSRQMILVNDRYVGDGYFSAMGIPLLRGRPFGDADRERNVAIISARLAAVLFPGRSPFGHKLTSGSFIKDAEIVGIVSDVHTTTLDRDPTLMIYVPYWKSAFQIADVVVRSSADPRALETDIRRAIQSIDASIPPPKMQTMEELVDRSVAQRRFQMTVAAGFGAAALLLAALGIYGVVAYSISMRRRELGVRMALGARTGQLRAMLLGRGLRPVVAGLAIGLLASAAAGQAVRGLLFGVAPTDALTLGGVTFTLGFVATLACLAPAESAARMDPANILRED